MDSVELMLRPTERTSRALLALLIGCLWGADAACGGELRRLDAASVLRSREPAWTLERREAAGKAMGKATVTYHFQHEEQALTVAVFTAATEQEAIAHMESLELRITAMAVPLPGVGDRGLKWISPQSGVTTIVLRKGSTVIHLVAPSTEVADRMAKHLNEALSS